MNIRILKGVSAVVGAAALVAACTGAQASPGSSTAAGGDDSNAGSQAPAGSQSAQGGGDASSMNGCSLLSPAEIQQEIGAAVKPGTFQTGNPDQTNCDWEGQEDDTLSVGVIVQPYDDNLWTAMSSAANATAVSGLGEAAFKDYPHPGDLSIKQGGHEIDLGIIDFKDDQQKVDAASLALAKLVLARV